MQIPGSSDCARVTLVRSPATSLGRVPASIAVWLLACTLLPVTRATAGPAATDDLSPVVTTHLPLADRLAAPGADPADSLFATPTTRDHIGRVVVPVMINGRGPFRFIVDTGANRSTISPQLVSALGLKPEDESTIVVNGITGAAKASFVTVDRLQAGALSIDGSALPVVWAPVMAGADGILGAAGLKEKSLLIDFQRNRVEIARHVEYFGRSESLKIHTLPPIHGLVTVDARVGGVRVTAIVDTGSERTLGNLALHNALRKPKSLSQLVQLTSVYGATADVESGEIELAPPIAIESLHISDVAIVYGDFHVFKVWGLTGSPAMIIGMDVLGRVASLSIDFKNQDIYITSIRERGMFAVLPGTLGDSVQKR